MKPKKYNITYITLTNYIVHIEKQKYIFLEEMFDVIKTTFRVLK